MLGIEPVRRSELPPKDAVEHYGPLAAVPAALREMRYQTVQLFEMVGRVFSGRVSVQNSVAGPITIRSEEHTSELQSLMRISYAVFCLKKKKSMIKIKKKRSNNSDTNNNNNTTRPT